MSRTRAPAEGARRPGDSLGRDVDHARPDALDHVDGPADGTALAEGVRIARKHLGWYLDTLHDDAVSAVRRKAILTSANPDEVFEGVRRIFEGVADRLGGSG